ncbi:SpoIIE family protein phosphatase [Actinomadura fibrosa]|uniref:SpoIIE family protein phosphatase n=1 Tax=Actinomadura fibrosa TaxID=111802 RepID=A0ABW2XZU3_9ACTN|nr:SpoIIE family protein phosphatase [Actinomadura fibrosa]
MSTARDEPPPVAEGAPPSGAPSLGVAADAAPGAAAGAAPGASGADTHTPLFLGQHLLGVARLAAVTLNGQGRVGHWNDAAADLFGIAPSQAIGRPVACVLRLPQEYRGSFEPEAFGHVWCDVCRVPRADTGELAEIGWWVYPIGRLGGPEDLAGDGGVRVLALAADMRALREDGPGLMLGDALVARPDGEARRGAGVRLLRVEPALAPPCAIDDPDDPDGFGVPGDPAPAPRALARLLTDLLPPELASTGPITARVLDLGCPAIALSLRIRLPVVPHRDDLVPAGRTALTTDALVAGAAARTGDAVLAGNTAPAGGSAIVGGLATAGGAVPCRDVVLAGGSAAAGEFVALDDVAAVGGDVAFTVSALPGGAGGGAVFPDAVFSDVAFPGGAFAGNASADTSGRPPGGSDPRPEQVLETMAVREPLSFLGEAGQQIGSSLDHLQAARTLAEVLVPRLADLAAVELLEGVVADSAPPAAVVDATTLMRRVAVVHNDEPGSWEDVVPEDEKLSLSERTPFVQAMRTGRTVHIPRVTAERAEQLSASCGRDLRALFAGRALLVVPLIARGRVLGTFKLLRKPDRPGFDGLDLAMIDELGRRAALCIDNGRLYRREVQVAQELQRSMLPDDPPEVAGARVRYRYRPAGQAAQVGGDWFDAIPLPGCRLGIVVGDVMGHGLTSAAIMGQLRTAVRTLAAEDMRPDRLLRQLDGLARRLGEGYLATCLYAVYDPIARTCHFANAGHVPPVLIAPDGDSRVLTVPAGVPIGVGGEPFETTELAVEDGAQLVLCTDGLLERRDRDIDQGLEEMRVRLAGVSRPLDGTCDALLDGLGSSPPADDVAIVVVGLDGIPAGDVASWELDPEPSMVPEARAEVAARLADWGLDGVTDTVELLVSELVTNALVHGAGLIGLRLIRGDTLLGEVYDDGQELPHLRHAEATDESGRGLQLVSHLAERWGTHRTEHGKVVWFEHTLPRASAR